MAEQLICVLCTSNNDSMEVAKQRCFHIVCWECLNKHVRLNLAPKIKCPMPNCPKDISDINIRKSLSEDDIKRYEKLQFDLLQEKTKCLLPECGNIYICKEKIIMFDCPKCTLFNCVVCKAAHRYLTCAQFKSIDEASQICQSEMERAKLKLKIQQTNITREMFKDMDEQDIFFYDNLLECKSCCSNLSKSDAVVLRCSHKFCRFCLIKHIKSSIIPILCLSDECEKLIQEREISALLSEQELEMYIKRCTSSVKGKLDFTFQCQTGDCLYFVTYSVKPDEVRCPLCNKVNCTKCFAIHTDETCEQFKDRIKETPYGKELLKIEERISRREWMRCLKCHQLLKKIQGCSWIQCINCNFEMCWALQMSRWGPKGRGDESAGCKCQLFGQRCSDDCESCEPHYNNPSENPLLMDENFQNFMILFHRFFLPSLSLN